MRRRLVASDRGFPLVAAVSLIAATGLIILAVRTGALDQLKMLSRLSDPARCIVLHKQAGLPRVDYCTGSIGTLSDILSAASMADWRARIGRGAKVAGRQPGHLCVSRPNKLDGYLHGMDRTKRRSRAQLGPKAKRTLVLAAGGHRLAPFGPERAGGEGRPSRKAKEEG